MKILLVSHKFAPDVGGIETMSELLANYFVLRGHEVTVVTHTKSEGAPHWPFALLREPSPRQLWRASREAEVVFHNNISLQFAWPQLLLRRPWVIAVRTWVTRNSGRVGVRDRIKRWVLARSTVIAISRGVAADLPPGAIVIPNGYRDDLFRRHSPVPRDPRRLVFVGRLVESKGVQILLEAMRELPSDIELEIIGTGPYENVLRQLVTSFHLESRVQFLGQLEGEDLVSALNDRGTMVVPSLWNEPFGIVALEGLAAGCFVIASEGGGLAEAVGPAGVTFPNGDAAALRDRILTVVSDAHLRDRLTASAAPHLRRHSREAMASQYLAVVERAAGA